MSPMTTHLRISAVSTAHTRRLSGGVAQRYAWRFFRKRSFRAVFRCFITSFRRRPSNRFAASKRTTTLSLQALSKTLNPVPNDSSSEIEATQASLLANGPLPETLILGELLGSGTFGDVYRGFDVETQEEIAVKVISKNRQGNDVASRKLVMERIEHEVSMWCALQSFPATVRLRKFYEDAERVYFVQELCNGGSLEDLMKIRGNLSEVEVAQSMQIVLSLAAFCHERQIAYCDIKPANFILPASVPGLNALHNSPHFVKVIDFGSCEHVPKRGLRGEKGTPLYTAPEVANSRYGVEADIWSAGVLMYYLLSGEFPFVGKPGKDLSPSALTFYLQFGELKFDPVIWKDVSEDAKELISLMLERNVKKRISAVDAMKHPWIKNLVANSSPETSNEQSAVSDICPMDTSVKVLEQTP